ncbi:MAG: hypothetical protein JW722_04850 [Demequinaceae bacterium]|nr:hypothetical protein [Demequinaceae bacterium]
MSDADISSTYVEIDIRTDEPGQLGLEASFDAIADTLNALPLAASADLAANLATKTLTLCITFERSLDPEGALRDALALARGALAHAGLDATAWDIARATVQSRGDQPHLVTA